MILYCDCPFLTDNPKLYAYLKIKFNVTLIIILNLYELSTYSSIVHDVWMRCMINDSNILFHISAPDCIKGININARMHLIEVQRKKEKNIKKTGSNHF